MNRLQAALRYEGRTIETSDGGRYFIVEITESSGRWFTSRNMRINKNGAIRKGDEDGRHVSSIVHEAVLVRIVTRHSHFHPSEIPEMDDT
jgi:hypothetical protein